MSAEKVKLPKGWEIKNLSEVGKIFNGDSINAAVKKEKYSTLTNGYPYIATKDIDYLGEIDYDNDVRIPSLEKNKFKVAPANTPLICVEGGSAGRKKGYTNQEVCFGNKLFALVVDNKNSSKYIFHYYSSELFQKSFNSELAGIIGGVSMNKFKDITIPLPPLPEQQRIVEILDKAFAAIDKAKANAAQNLNNAKALFESYLNGIFEKKGNGWEELTLGDVIYKTETTDPIKRPKKEFIYLDVSSVNKDTKKIETISTLLGKDAPSRARKLIRTNDVIFATVRPTHSRVAIITEDYNEQVCSTGYFVLRAKEFINYKFIFYFLLTYDVNKVMESMQKGASYPAVTDAEVKSVHINFPDINKQIVIVKKLDSLSLETKKLEAIYQQKIKDLDEMKKSILQKAFAGELKTEN